MKRSTKLAIAGFLFGTLGMFLLAGLSLVSPVAETVFGPLFWPGRALSSLLFGANGTDGAVAVLMLCNGLLYAAVFVGIAKVIALTKQGR